MSVYRPIRYSTQKFIKRDNNKLFGIQELSGGAFLNGYRARQPVSVSRVLVPGAVSGAPLLARRTHVDLATVGNGGLSQTGFDFRLETLAGTVIPYYKHSYNPVTGLLELVFRAPLIFDGQNTFYLYFNNGSIGASVEDKAGVWNSKGLGVYHLPSKVDCSGQGKDFDLDALTGAAVVGSSGNFDGSRILTRNDVTVFQSKNSIYISFFCKSNVSGTDNVCIALGSFGGSTPIFFRHDAAGDNGGTNVWTIGYTFSERAVRFESPSNSGSNNQQQHIAFQIAPGVAPKMWIDGVPVFGISTTIPSGGAMPTSGVLLVNGTDHFYAGRGSVSTRLWDGLIDELRMLNDVMGNDYVLTEHNNLVNINEFCVFGDTETLGSKFAPRNELITATVPSAQTVRIDTTQFLENLNSDIPTIDNVTAPNIGIATKVDDTAVDYLASGGSGIAQFDITYNSGGKITTSPVRVTVGPGGPTRPPPIDTMVLLPDRVSWAGYVRPTGFDGFQVRSAADLVAAWEEAVNVGALTLQDFILLSALPVGTLKALAKPVANGLEALMAAEIILSAPPPPPGNYYSSPNYGSKTKIDVGDHNTLMNRIGDINPAIAYINMTYVDNLATVVGRGGTSANPLIITAQAPNGLTNFAGRPGFTKQLDLNADYVWVDRLSIKSNNENEALVIRNNWKFVTRCQIDAGQGIVIPDDGFANEWWIGFNRFTGVGFGNKDTVNAGTQGQIHIQTTVSGAGRPKNGRIYYNDFNTDGGTTNTEQYAILSGPGLKQGSEDAEYAGVNIDGSWIHYNYVNTPNRWGIYLKHGLDCLYNHVAGADFHSISTRGECINKAKIKFNRMTGGSQSSIQGWHMEVVGNIVTSTNGLLISCEYRLNPTTKITRAARYALVAGNTGDLTIGECRNGSKLEVIAPVKNVSIEKHTGSFFRWIDDDHRTQITPVGNVLPESPTYSGDPSLTKRQLYDNDTITIKGTTSQVLDTVPVLSPTICGPGSTRGKVWGT